MAQCEVCGNEYDKTFEVVLAGRSHVPSRLLPPAVSTVDAGSLGTE